MKYFQKSTPQLPCMFRSLRELKNYERKTKLTDNSQAIYIEVYAGFSFGTAYSLLRLSQS